MISLDPRYKTLHWLALAGLSLASAGRAGADDPLPTPWNGMDIGGPSQAGTAKTDNGVFTLTGGGGALAETNDRFHFVYQSLTGDCAFTARVSAGANSNDLAAGVMARQALASNSDFVAVTLTPGHGTASLSRTPFAPKTTSESVSTDTPVWVKLMKRGTVVRSYAAADKSGTPGTWKQVGGSQPIPSGMIYVGLCVASGAPGATVAFDHVSLVTDQQLLFDDGVYTITPAGAPNMALAPAGGEVKLTLADGSATQKWRFVHKNGFYRLQSLMNPSLVLSVPGAKTDNGSPVAVTADQGQNTQRWSIVINSNGTYSFLPQFNTSLCLDDFGGNTTPVAVIDIWSYSSADPHLQWAINSAP